MSDKPLFAAVRVIKMKTLAQIKYAENHALRLDDASARRVDKGRTHLNLTASRYCPANPNNLVEAFKKRKAEAQAVEAKNAAIAMNIICVVSPELLEEAGNRHDPANPINQKIFTEAQAWAEATFGDGSLINARLDLDEAGSGVVDLFVVPVHMKKGGRGREEKPTISVKAGLEGVKRETPQQKTYSALQDSWANWCKQRVDPRLVRGKPKRETMRQHVHADLFRKRAEELYAREQTLKHNWLALEDEKAKLALEISQQEETVSKAVEETQKALQEEYNKKSDELARTYCEAVNAVVEEEIEMVYEDETGWKWTISSWVSEERRKFLDDISQPTLKYLGSFLAMLISFFDQVKELTREASRKDALEASNIDLDTGHRNDSPTL